MAIEYEIPETGGERFRRYIRDYAYPVAVEAARYGSGYLYRELENSLQDLVSSGVKRTFSGYIKTPPPRYSQLTESQSSKAPSVGVKRMPKYTVGYFGKRFSRRGRTKSSKFAVSYKNEVAGTITNANTAYIGHGPAYVTVLRMLCMAIYERLRKKHGSPVLDWNDFNEINGQIVVNDLNGNPAATSSNPVVTAMGTSDSHSTVVGNMINFFYNKFRDGEPDDTERNYEALIISLQIFDDDGVVNTANNAASINLANCMISINFYSYLNLQNSTLGAGVNDDQADDVTNNPVVGRVYTGRGNGWRWKRVVLNGAGSWAATANRDYGYIHINAAGFGTQLTQTLVRPPDKNMLANVQKVGSARLAPGQMRGDRIRQTVKLSVNTLFYKLKHPLKEKTVGVTSVMLFYMFSYRMFAFEKQMRSGSDVAIQYELDQVYRATLHERRATLPAIQNIGPTVNLA